MSSVFFVFSYLLALPLTYILPYFGSNSVTAVVLTAGVAGLGTIVHLLCFLAMIVIAAMRGRSNGFGFLWLFPVLALVFDFAPILSSIPFIPTIFHVIALVVGAGGQSDDAIDLRNPAVLRSLAGAAGDRIMTVTRTGPVSEDRPDEIFHSILFQAAGMVVGYGYFAFLKLTGTYSGYLKMISDDAVASLVMYAVLAALYYGIWVGKRFCAHIVAIFTGLTTVGVIGMLFVPDELFSLSLTDKGVIVLGTVLSCMAVFSLYSAAATAWFRGSVEITERRIATNDD